MTYRPQFPFAPAPEGFEWAPCIYQFDKINTPALGGVSLASKAESGYIPLATDQDACFVLMAVRLNSGALNVQLFDPWGNPLSDDYVQPTEYAGSTFPVAVLEGGNGLEVPEGATFSIRLQGQ